MPIEIRELVIRATVGKEEEKGKKGGGMDEASREEIVAECVEQVMEILRRRNER